jgi:hypothetical protein
MSGSAIRISFLGDISLNNRYCKIAEKNPFKEFPAIVAQSDYVVGNLEAMMYGEDGFNLKKTPYLYTDAKGIAQLGNLKLDLVSTAHNHIYDNFESGYSNTIASLKSSNIDYVGSSIDNNSYCEPFVTEIENVSFAFLNYCHSDTNYAKPENTRINLNVYDREIIVRDIGNARNKADFIILLLHWGGKTDYGFLPSMEQVEDAKFFIDRGADCIVGHHAHCVQPLEIYKGKPIFYCLGNFCFDDIQSHGKTFQIRKSGKKGIMAHIQFSIKNKKVDAAYSGIENDNLDIVESKKPIVTLSFIHPIFFLYKKFKVVRIFYSIYLKKVEPMIFFYQSSDKTFYQKLKRLNYNKLKGIYKQFFG